MKLIPSRYTSLIALIAASSLLLLAYCHRGTAGAAPGPGSPVVVELFTSEGCSSCPPADALLARLGEQPSSLNVEVIALEEHVDYWNQLGWYDPFSSPDWTARQSAYAKPLGNGNPYTPQMVVDGSVEFVGSLAQQALKFISEAAQRPKTAVTLSQGNAAKPEKGDFSVSVGKLPGAAGGSADVWLAITESGLHSDVKGGENVGHDLHHAAIVRAMRQIGEAKGAGDTSFTGSATISLRKEWKRENLRAVVFVQEKKTLRIIGAAQISLRS
ncbi:MAG TPA: DUF1223 domain-containing protein [Candidatus Angelobacter sp.]|nr:DUF1223 domain-containing protein [Candidatus Angelobacter sp.]